MGTKSVLFVNILMQIQQMKSQEKLIDSKDIIQNNLVINCQDIGYSDCNKA